MLTELCTQLFFKIGRSNGFVKIAALAEEFRISPRTVRYNLDKIDEFLKYRKLPPLIRKTNMGIGYTGPMELVLSAMEELQARDSYSYMFSQQERVDIILAVLLQQKGYITIDDLAQKLTTSRSTVIKDLKIVRALLNKNHLSLHSSTKHGIKIAGEEKQLRRTSIELLMKAVEFPGILNEAESPALKKTQPLINHSMQTEISNLFRDVDIRFIGDCVLEGEKQLESIFSDEAFYGLVVHIAIAMKRIRLGRDIVMSHQELKSYELTKEFAAASCIARKLEEHFSIEVPYDEIGYITVHLLGSNVYDANPEYREDWAVHQVLTGKILHIVSDRLKQEVLLSDKQLFHGLLDHLRPAIYRLKNDLKIKNPILEAIKSNYYDLFESVKAGMAPVESYAGKPFTEEETGYFTLHFGAALERLKEQNEREKNVLVVCSTGLGTARFLAARLRQTFNVNVVGIIAYRQVREFLQRQKADLIVTTLSAKFESIPCVQVSPLLTGRDIENVKPYLNAYKFPPRDVLAEVLQLIEQNCEIKKYDELANGLAKILKTDYLPMRRGAVQPLLRDLLTGQTISLNVEVKDWEEAIGAGGKLLEDNGYIEHRYVEAMIDTVKKLGPYIVIAQGIAMPHARPEDGAKKVGMALVTLKNPVAFGNKEYDPVQVVVFVCAIDTMTHLKALAELMTLLEDAEFRELAERAADKQEIIDYINR